MVNPLILLAILVLPNIHAVPMLYCFEYLPNEDPSAGCGLYSGNITKIFQAPNQPLESIASGFSLVILWGLFLGVIWFKTERIDILGVVGLVVAATATGMSQQAIGIGVFLLFVSLGLLAFQVFRQRVVLFT